ncbi:MAG: hypothetical protein N3A61_02505 [Ignavibacteria bacterium]|nr:hypothetical protein [Ignavibacteria bacterium]
MISNSQKIIEAVNEVLNENNAFLVNLKIGQTKSGKNYMFFIDKDEKFTIEDCFRINKQINRELTSKNLIQANDTIEVSSPGAEAPLKLLRQFHKHINRKFRVNFLQGSENVVKELTLKRIEDENLVFELDGEELKINFNNIKEAKVILSFK